jgi:hypothetical protein
MKIVYGEKHFVVVVVMMMMIIIIIIIMIDDGDDIRVRPSDKERSDV